MGDHSIGRSLTEVILAVVLVGFLTGFVAVLCIGNYYRAKRAMERQRQRRLMTRLSTGGNVDSSPRSHYSSATSGGGSTIGSGADEKQHLLARPAELPRRRTNFDEDAHDLMLFSEDQESEQLQHRREPSLVRV